MKANKIPPAFIRYLKPRLQPFSRPIFWGSLSILSLLGVIIYQYGRYSDWLEASSEKTTNSDSLSDKNLPNQVDSSQFSPEDLAIGADIDNLDLLLQQVNQNQNFSLDLSSNSQENSATQNSQDKSLNRFQAKQQAPSKRSSLFLNSLPNSQNNPLDKNFLDRLNNQLPQQSFQENSTLLSPINNSIDRQSASSPSSHLISNPVGRLYLSNRQQFFNSHQPLSTEKNLPHSVNRPSSNEVNSVPTVISPLTTIDSLHGSATETNTQTNNTSITPLVDRSQPINNLQSNNLTNYQIQTLNFYQLHPSNYQLQPQGLEQLDRGNLPSQSNSSVSNKFLDRSNPIDRSNLE